MRPRFFLVAVVLQLAAPIAFARAMSEVPFVGCQLNVQGEVHDAPQGSPKAIPATADVAKHLAFYRAESGPGVLGPRGWSCFGVASSHGQTLYVSPEKTDPALFYSQAWKGFAGPAIQLSLSIGDTSGRFTVAQVIARVFPAYRSFAQQVIDEGVFPAGDFPAGPFPKDRLHYVNDHTVEYRTPPASEGLGTYGHLHQNNEPIEGVAIFDSQTPNLIELMMRLPPALTPLTPMVIRQVEREGSTLQ